MRVLVNQKKTSRGLWAREMCKVKWKDDATGANYSPVISYGIKDS